MNKLTRIIIITLSLAYVGVVVSAFTADRLRDLSDGYMAEERYDDAIEAIDNAIILDPSNTELYYDKFEVIRRERKARGETVPSKHERHLIKKCIELRPFWPKYHFVYGLLLSKLSDNPNYMLKNSIIAELKKASDLKPYSKMYSRIYQKYLNHYK